MKNLVKARFIAVKYYLRLLVWHVLYHSKIFIKSGIMKGYIFQNPKLYVSVTRDEIQVEYNLTLQLVKEVFEMAMKASCSSINEANKLETSVRCRMKQLSLVKTDLTHQAAFYAFIEIFNLANQRRVSLAFAGAR